MENKILSNIFIVFVIMILAGSIIWGILSVTAVKSVDNTIDDTKLSVAKSEASLVVSQINNWCAVSAMKSQLQGTIDICADGLTTLETKNMIEQADIEVLDITFENNKVTYLKIESNKVIIEYNGATYELVK